MLNVVISELSTLSISHHATVAFLRDQVEAGYSLMVSPEFGTKVVPFSMLRLSFQMFPRLTTVLLRVCLFEVVQ